MKDIKDLEQEVLRKANVWYYRDDHQSTSSLRDSILTLERARAHPAEAKELLSVSLDVVHQIWESATFDGDKVSPFGMAAQIFGAPKTILNKEDYQKVSAFLMMLVKSLSEGKL